MSDHELSEAEQEAISERHRHTQGREWLTVGQPGTCVLISTDVPSKTVGIGVALKVTEGVASLSLAVLSIDDAIVIRDGLGDSIDGMILADYRRWTRDDAGD